MAKQIKSLEQQIDEYKNDSRFKPYVNQYNNNVYEPSWHWDESWDGQLIKDVIALDQAGFTIVEFSRKRKVTLKYPEKWETTNINTVGYPIKKRGWAVELICETVGDSWYSISFKPTLSIYWKGRSSKWNI